MSDGVGLVLVAEGQLDPDVVADCARVGVGAVRADVVSTADVLVLRDDQGPRSVVLGVDPVPELAALLDGVRPDTLAVGGADVRAVLAGLAAGTHLHVRAAGERRDVVAAAARAGALARLAGRPPLDKDSLRSLWT